MSSDAGPSYRESGRVRRERGAVMAARCTKHSFEVAVAQCRSCSEPFCDECLVYTYGPSSPPFCVPCALVAAGVRRMSTAEKKAMRAGRKKHVDIDASARSQITMTVGYDGAAVDEKTVLVGEVPPSDEVAAEVVPGTAGGRFPLAWVAIVAGILLLAVPFVASSV